MSAPSYDKVPALEEALYMAVRRLEWLKHRVNHANPHRKNSAAWRDWDRADMEQFDALDNELEIFRDLLNERVEHKA